MSLISPLVLSLPTSDIQLALHLILAQFIDCHAGVFSSVKGARLANVEGQHSLVVLHQVLWILANDHLVLHPDDLRLDGTNLNVSLKFSTNLKNLLKAAMFNTISPPYGYNHHRFVDNVK